MAEQAGISLEEAQDAASEYFRKFPRLKTWLKETQDFIAQNGYLYSPFGRKRRLKNAFSSDKGVAGHDIRSGVNFTIQSTCSDINLMGAIELLKGIKIRKLDAKVFMLVHDSIVAEVKIEHIDKYVKLLAECVQRDRGVGIPGCDIGIDVDDADDYSFDNWEKEYEEKFNKWKETKWDSCPT